jgi:hypothetical protein
LTRRSLRCDPPKYDAGEIAIAAADQLRAPLANVGD